MRPVVVGLVLLATACAAGTAPPAAPALVRAPPDWLPPYNPKQLALLAPSDERVTAPASRTYPETSQFRYARDRVLEDPRDAMRVTKVVADVVSESDHTYMVASAGPDVANTVAQYGPVPAPAPDPWLVTVKDRSGRKHLAPVAAPESARNAVLEGDAALRAKDPQQALAAFKRAAQQAPAAPAPQLGLARALEQQGDESAAEGAYREALRLDPTLATAHEGLGALLLDRGDVHGARVSLAHALAYHPVLPRALALAKSVGKHVERVQPFAIFLEVDARGVVRIASGPSAGARMYAGCRAIMRYEPELRSTLFEIAPNEPYFLSVAEEMFCLESAIGAYLADRAVAREEGRKETADPQSAALLGLAHSEGLLGFVMFEILGRHRPEHARTAPMFVHRAAMSYVQRHLLGYDPGPEDAAYMAALDR